MQPTVAHFLQKNNNNLDLVRLVCAILVLCDHVSVFMVGAKTFDAVKIVFPFSSMGTMSVQTFFFISGMLVANSLFDHKNWRAYLVSRFFRIWPALLVCALVCAAAGVVAWTGDSLAGYVPEALKWIRGTLLMQYGSKSIQGISFMTNQAQEFWWCINGSLWTLPHEVTMYLLLLGVWMCFNSFIRSRAIQGCVCLILVLSPMFSQLYGPLWEEGRWLISMFFAGVLFALYKDKISLNYMVPSGFLICALILQTNENVYHFFAYMSVVTFLVWLAGLSIVRKIKISKDISYGVYIYAWPIQQFLLYSFPTINYWLYLLLCILIAVLFGYLSCVLIERPSIKFGKKINSHIWKSKDSFK